MPIYKTIRVKSNTNLRVYKYRLLLGARNANDIIMVALDALEEKHRMKN